jgi:UDP-2,3-diacylglucosamine pyrophosphatase LpxH
MYNSTNSKDVAILKKIAEKNKNSKGRIQWANCKDELNLLFGESLSAQTWSKRYERLNIVFSVTPIPAAEPLVENKRETLIAMIKNPKTMGELSLKLGLNKYEVLGLIKEIESEGIYTVNIGTIGGEYVFTLEKALVPQKVEYSHSIGDTRTFTFMVISDSHMGSKNEQVTFLHYLYDLAQERGIHNVYHCGDISEGFKKSRDDHIYSLHAISFDDQADHIIRNYPERDGITTYFITGNHDHFHIQNGGANIGKRISASRQDMVYLGINTAVINLTHNCKMELFHPQDGSSYAMSYSGQKYLDSLSGGDKPHMLFVGHHHKYISMWYRNVWYFEVPSTHLQSDWEKGKRIRNDSGALIVTVTVDEDGTLLDCNHSMIPHVKHIKNDWMQYAIKE